VLSATWTASPRRSGVRPLVRASSGAKVAIPLLGAYSASKFGLEGMSDALRRELMLFGIDVVIIEPGTVNTSMYDKGEKEDLSEFKPTEYWEAVQNFQKFLDGYDDVVEQEFTSFVSRLIGFHNFDSQ
jgi:short-subunit dehydrogenase